ncbi:DUF453-domain-containing protein [Melanomma pulvis-pyrius CBS 109.77]|uniref:DUF453-domain-containing protein n=1 Tax=Melanomma pulvis-pyrius CBS 109.77 TaxID=1314802 RepID=A0A6A6XLP3_9PLEO|nr:DUF453-domain-containing protein [Melanomma pulvis-pyrius CBS 109.77]
MRFIRPFFVTRNTIRIRIGNTARRSAHTSTPHILGPQKPIKAAYYRGGTSRGVIFQPKDLPLNRKKWPAIFRQIMGSPDPYGRQLDGMGAGISSLSKICLVERMKKKIQVGTDDVEHRVGIDYTFVGIGIDNDLVDVAGNCGNMSSAVGPYAYNAGLLAESAYRNKDGNVTVRIRNTNTLKYIDSTFPVVKGQAAVLGSYAIDGVAGTASKIKLDFREPYGSKTGKVLPTGRKIDTIAGYKVTCVDGANPCIFIRADDLGINGTILPADFNKLPNKLALLEGIRRTAAVAMGIAATEDEVPFAIPKIGIVSMSSTHTVLSGVTLKNSQTDLIVRFLSDTQPHRAIPLTAALTTAVAARIPGTLVEQLLAPDPVDESALTIGHASGRIQVNAIMEEKNPLIPVSASVYRTARRIFEGKTYWTDEKSESNPSEEPEINKSQLHSLGLAFVEESRGRDPSYLYDGLLDDDELPVRTVHVEPWKTPLPTGPADKTSKAPRTRSRTLPAHISPIGRRESRLLLRIRALEQAIETKERESPVLTKEAEVTPPQHIAEKIIRFQGEGVARVGVDHKLLRFGERQKVSGGLQKVLRFGGPSNAVGGLEKVLQVGERQRKKVFSNGDIQPRSPSSSNKDKIEEE